AGRQGRRRGSRATRGSLRGLEGFPAAEKALAGLFTRCCLRRLRGALRVVACELGPLLKVFFETFSVDGLLLGARELPCQGVVVRLRAEVLQLPSDLGVLCFLTAAPHGLDPLTIPARRLQMMLGTT